MKTLLVTFILAFNSYLLFGQRAIINTIAGGGSDTSDTCLGISASIFGPVNMTIDAYGNLYFIEHYLSIIRKLDTNGVLTRIAGSGRNVYSGDGGLAINAQFRSAVSLCVDSTNNLYIVDSDPNRIRKIDFTTGIITTVFGSGSSIDSGDGGPAIFASFSGPFSICKAPNNDFLVAQHGAPKIRRINHLTSIVNTIAGDGTRGFSGDGSPATSCKLHGCRGLSCDSNNVFIADWYNGRVRRIDSNGIITTICGTGSGGGTFNGDSIRAIDANSRPLETLITHGGELIVSEMAMGRIRKIGSNDTIYTIAGSIDTGFSGDGGPATNAKIGGQVPGLVEDDCGNIIFSDCINHRIRKITYPYGNQPTITITQDDTQIPCYSLPVSFTASTRLAGRAPTYQWQVNGVNRGTSSPTFSYLPTHGDVVRCILRSNLYCVINPYDTSNEIHVVVDSLTPPVLTIGGPSTATLSSTVPLSTTISGGSFSSYNLQWRNSGALVATTTTPSYSYTKGPDTDSFTVTLTSIDRGCYDSATSAIHTVSLPVGFNNTTSNSNTWEVYPNPAHQKLFIANKQLILGKLTLFNALGTEVYTTQSTGHQAVIDISALPVGVYTLSANNIFITKFTKE